MKTVYRLNCVIMVALFFQCRSHKNINFYYKERSEAVKEDLIAEEYYYKNVSKDKVRKDGETLLLIHGEAFRGGYVVINESDTVDLRNVERKEHCIGQIFYKVNKKSEKLKLSSNLKTAIEFNLNHNYDYVRITGGNDNKWGIVYSEFFPSIICY